MPVKQHPVTASKSGNIYHNDYTTTNAYVELSFGFPADVLSLINDSDSDESQISYDGATLHYTLDPGEYKDIPAAGKTSVYVKATTGGEKVRVTAV